MIGFSRPFELFFIVLIYHDLFWPIAIHISSCGAICTPPFSIYDFVIKECWDITSRCAYFSRALPWETVSYLEIFAFCLCLFFCLFVCLFVSVITVDNGSSLSFCQGY